MKRARLGLIISIAVFNLGCLFAQDSSSGPYNFKDFPTQNSGSGAPSVTPEASTQPAPSSSSSVSTPTFRTSSNIRQPDSVGLSVGAYGGAIAFQDGDLHITSTSAPGEEIKGNTQSELGGVAGIRLENTWQSFSAISGDAILTKPSVFMPAMGIDLFWTGYRYQANDATFGSGSNLRADINTFTFMFTPKLKFDLGAYRPYVGLGVGGTYVNAGNAQVNVPGVGSGNLTGSSDDFDFSAEALAGIEVFVDPHWSVSFDYKYLYILDPTFHGNIDGAPIQYKINGLNNSLFTAGINFYF